MIFKENYTLANGVLIPKLGLGTWMIPDSGTAEAVRQAVSIGYRHIDTAQAYQNERGVGEGVRTCGIDRRELFVTTKVAAEHKGYDVAAASIGESLKKMELDYIDLVIIHAPQPWNEFRGEKRYFAENREVWKALEDAYEAGKVRAIGVSNFLTSDLQNILDGCKIRPMVNQILLHNGETPSALVSFCQKNDIRLEAYSPIAHGAALRSQPVAEVAKKYGVSVAQLCIQYTLQLGAVSLPKSSNPDHIRSNAQLDFTISDSDMQKLESIGQDYGSDSRFPVFSERRYHKQ